MSSDERSISTGGGGYFQGDIKIDGGDLVARDKHIHQESFTYNTQVTLVSLENSMLSLASGVNTKGAAELLQLLLEENERNLQEKGFVREEADKPLLARLLNSFAKSSSPRYKTHLPFLDNGSVFLSRFRIKGFIGRGGFSDAYIAWDMVQDREAILKRLQYIKTQESYLNRFVERERVIAGRLRSQPMQGIVHTYDILQAQDEICLVQEHIPGQSLHERIKERGVLSIAEAIVTTRRVCEALQSLHTHGIVHCDIKPLNIIITSPGKPVVIDLGAARFVNEQIKKDEVVVSPLYSAPELYTAEPIDSRVDVYALGITLLHMISGLPDIAGLVIGENVVNRPNDDPHRIYETSPLPLEYTDLPPQDILRQHTEKTLTQIGFPQLQTVLQQSIADRDHRFESIKDFNEALAAFE